MKVCGLVPAASWFDAHFSGLLASQGSFYKEYKKAPLSRGDGKPLREEDIEPYKAYIFFYPHIATPCFLLKLNHEIKPVEVRLKDHGVYKWGGGVGSKGDIVAYSAICSHQWSCPTRQRTFIQYYPPDKSDSSSGAIRCCAHRSAFDPENGGSVLQDPALVALTSMVLRYENARFYAVGTLGKEQFDDFFDTARSELMKEYGSSSKARQLVDRSTVIELERYTREIVTC